MIKDYITNNEKYVYSLIIQEKNKTREIITYNKDENGFKLREYHNNVLQRLNELPSSPYSYAYKKGLCTKAAVISHINSNLFIKLDISSFFESIKLDAFLAKKVISDSNLDLNMIQGCFYKEHLSLGYVTSPRISDLYLYDFDEAIAQYLNSHKKLKYTRYCDDILISSKDCDFGELHTFLSFIKKKLNKLDLNINEKKLREFDLDKDTAVTFLGLNISKGEKENKITISKSFILKTLDLLEKFYKFTKVDKEELRNNLRARLYYQRHNNIEESEDYALETKELYFKYLRKLKQQRDLFSSICSRVSYIKFNSSISYERFLNKHQNKFNFKWSRICRF